jgi:CPA2 family monovalent cation:H+ antiporter-2
MNGEHILLDIAIILISAFLGGLLFRHFNQSIVVGYLLSGILIGPYGLGIFKSPDQIEVLSEIGIILLMFILGLSFPPKKIIKMGWQTLIGGVLQVSLTIIGVICFAYLAGWNLFTGSLVGVLIALSSTAIVIKVLNDLGAIDSLHGRLMVSYLIVQDIVAVLMIAILPSLGNEINDQIIFSILTPLTKGLVFLGVFLLLNRKIIPRIQHWVAAVGGKELFLIGTIIFCIGMAAISQMIGLSLALGAFLAGFIVSESEFNYQMLAGMVPFRDAFLCIFFVAIGMLLDPRFIFHYPWEVVVLFVCIILGKFLFAFLATYFIRHPLKIAILVGAGLAHMGEFSFVIIKMGLQHNLISEHFFNLYLTSSLLTMFVTPFMIRKSPTLINSLNRVAFIEKWLRGKEDRNLLELEAKLRKHVIICGYGPIGIILGRVLSAKKIPFVSLELNAQTVVKMRGLGLHCFYGDATSPEVLKKVNIEEAMLVVITIPDPMSTEAIVKNVKDLNPDCFILARTRFSKELEDLYVYGADAVIQEEFEAGLAILVRALKELKVSNDDIDREVEAIKIERDELTKTHYFGPLNFSRQISPQRVILNLLSRTKEDAIRELIQSLPPSHKIPDKEELIKRVLEREQIETTGIGRGIAIPHARTDAVEGICICLGISPKGINYGSIDDKPVHILILLTASESAHDAYLNALASVASLFNDRKFCQDIINCTEPAKVLRLIIGRERTIRNQSPEKGKQQ